MGKLTVYQMTFSNGLHVGTRGVNLEESAVTVPSDTLFAALVDVFCRSGGNPDALLAPFPRQATEEEKPARQGQVPFRLTSAFPFAGGVRFFPMPVPLQWFFSDEVLKVRRKEIKRIRFVSEGLFRLIVQGHNMDDWLFPTAEDRNVAPGVTVQGTAFWLMDTEREFLPDRLRQDDHMRRKIKGCALRYHKIFAQEHVPRVTINRITSATDIFHAGRVRFAPGCGLWFGVDWRMPDALIADGSQTYQQAFAQSLALLQDDGLGGERTAGYGAFHLEQGISDLTLPVPVPDTPQLLLSRYHPRCTELPQALGAGMPYDLVAVGGWLRSWGSAAQRRKRLWMLEAGSVIHTLDDGPQGDVVDVRPTYTSATGDVPHPVWRYGIALGVGIQGGYHA